MTCIRRPRTLILLRNVIDAPPKSGVERLLAVPTHLFILVLGVAMKLQMCCGNYQMRLCSPSGSGQTAMSGKLSIGARAQIFLAADVATRTLRLVALAPLLLSGYITGQYYWSFFDFKGIVKRYVG